MKQDVEEVRVDMSLCSEQLLSQWKMSHTNEGLCAKIIQANRTKSFASDLFLLCVTNEVQWKQG